ncbi:unnamed protein product [Taenia asiatica]|uniref:Actin-related protein 2/3 complex subunit 5 n=1 Tax=Taenia asiatica TaxID=60517 RepID=A0A0R3W9L4_TAEAS|nr:unnamed protein product [Taenia asiatica]
MAKNTGDTRFRKLDVDNFGQSTFDEEGVDDTHLDPRDVESLLSRQAFCFLTLSLSCTIPVYKWDVCFEFRATRMHAFVNDNLITLTHLFPPYLYPAYTCVCPFSLSGKYEEAVRTVLDNAPVNSKDVRLKEAVAALVLRGMSSIRSNQIDAFVGGLNQEQLDILMKYIYRGFDKPADITYPALLTWHEKVCANRLFPIF